MARSIFDDEAALTDTVPLQVGNALLRSQQVPRVLAEAAFVEYDYACGGQTFERLHERGGFGVVELMGLLYDRIQRLEQTIRDNQM